MLARNFPLAMSIPIFLEMTPMCISENSPALSDGKVSKAKPSEWAGRQSILRMFTLCRSAATRDVHLGIDGSDCTLLIVMPRGPMI